MSIRCCIYGLPQHLPEVKNRFKTVLCSLSWLNACFLCLYLFATGCVPVPVSTVPLHPRQVRPVAFETAAAENFGTFSAPAYDASGTFLAVYDSGSDLVRIFQSADLKPVDSFKPTRRPRRLSFSQGGHFLVIEEHQGWIDDFLNHNKRNRAQSASSHVNIDSPEAYQDSIQRVEVWDLHHRKSIPNLSCDAVVTSKPQGGWLWARNWAITPGYHSSALLEAHFSTDETEFSILCWNGVQQRWDARTWKRLADTPPPPFWNGLMGLTPASWLAENDSGGRSSDGRIALLRVREKAYGFPGIYLWDRNSVQARQLPGECGSRLLPVYALDRDANRLVAACNKGLGYEIRVWELDSGKEIPLADAVFGLSGGFPALTGGGVALSPDGRYLAVSLLAQIEALLPNVLLIPAGIDRSDLRLWDVDKGKELVTVSIDDLLGSVGYFGGVDLAFSPDNTLLAVCGRKLRIYRLQDLIPASP